MNILPWEFNTEKHFTTRAHDLQFTSRTPYWESFTSRNLYTENMRKREHFDKIQSGMSNKKHRNEYMSFGWKGLKIQDKIISEQPQSGWWLTKGQPQPTPQIDPHEPGKKYM